MYDMKKKVTYQDWVKLTAQKSAKEIEMPAKIFKIRYTNSTPSEWDISQDWATWETKATDEETAENQFKKWTEENNIDWTGYTIVTDDIAGF